MTRTGTSRTPVLIAAGVGFAAIVVNLLAASGMAAAVAGGSAIGLEMGSSPAGSGVVWANGARLVGHLAATTAAVIVSARCLRAPAPTRPWILGLVNLGLLAGTILLTRTTWYAGGPS